MATSKTTQMVVVLFFFVYRHVNLIGAIKNKNTKNKANKKREREGEREKLSIPKMSFLLPKISAPPLLHPPPHSTKSSQNALLKFHSYSSPPPPSPLIKLDLPPLRDSAQDKPSAVQDKQGTAQDKEKKERDDFYLNVGMAVRTLREDIPALFYKDLNYDIYRFATLFFRVLILFLFGNLETLNYQLLKALIFSERAYFDSRVKRH